MKTLWTALVLVTAIFVSFTESNTFKYKGLPITIEHMKGSIRSGTDVQGNYWEQEMFHHYGYFDGIIGADGKQLDVFIDPDNESSKIFKIIQLDALTKDFDEYKIMIGFDNIQDAKQGYLIHYPDDWAGYGGIEEITLQDIK